MARHPVMVDPRYGQAAANTLPVAARPSGRRWRLLAVTGLGLIVAGWLTGLTSSARGWLTIGLAELLLILLAAHHRDGGRRWLARILCEYAAVALLVFLAITAAGVDGTHQPPPARHQTRQATAHNAGTSAGHLARDARTWLAGWWQWATQQANDHGLRPPTTPTTTPTPSRKHHR